MFKKIRNKVIDVIKSVFDYIERDREKQADKIRAKRAVYLEQKRRENDKILKETIKEHNKKRRDSVLKLRRTFTTIEEYKQIAGNRCKFLDKLPPHERDIVAQRVQKLCKEKPEFKRALEEWAKQNYELPNKEPKMQGIQRQTRSI